MEFVAKLPSPAKTDPRKEVLSSALQPLDSSVGPRMNELIASVGKLGDDNLKKPLLQIIARSGWAGERNSNLLVRMMIYVNVVLRQESKDFAAIGKVVSQIDNLLEQEENFDLNLLGRQIGNFLTVDRDLIILGRVFPSDKFGDPVDEAIAMEFDLLVVDYFKQNNLGTEYLKDFSGIIASQARLESIKTKLIVLAKTAPAQRAIRTKMKGLIGMVGEKAQSLHKPLLQIIGRSGWTSGRNPSVVDKMVSFFAKLSTPVDVAKLGRVVFSIDALLVRTEIDLESLGDDIGDILTSEDEIVVLDRAIFGANVDERTKAQRFDALVKSYYVDNRFETGYLGHLTRLCNGISGITDKDKTGIMAIVDKVLVAPVSDTPRLDIHLALATIEYFAKFKRLPESAFYSEDSDTVAEMLKKLASVPIASYKSIFFELIGICAWDPKSQLTCLERMADFLNFPQWLFVVDASLIPNVLQQVTNEWFVWSSFKPKRHFFDLSSLCGSLEHDSQQVDLLQQRELKRQKLDCLKQMEAFAIHSVIRLRGNIENSFDKGLSDIVHEIELVESGLEEMQKPKNLKALNKHGK